MQVKKKPRNAAAKKIQKAPPKEKHTKKEQTEQPLLKRVIFGEERPDLTELEAGSTTILDILAPTTVDTKSKDYIVVDGVYHTYLYITGYGYATTVGSCWLAPLVEAGEGVNMSFLVKRQSKEKILSKIAQTTMVNRSRMRDVGDTRQDYEELDSAINSGLYLKDVMNRQGEDFYYIVSLGGIYYTAHYVCPGIGRMAVNDELAAFHNHTNFGKNTQRAFLFAGSSYESVIEELKTQDEKRNEKLIRYGEAYHCLHAPIHLLSCDETGAQQLQIMTVPDYRVKLTRLMLRSAYQPPPEDIAAWDGLYNGHPFVVGADMDLRRIDTAVRTAKQHGCLPIALAALEGQGSAVLLQRYADPGCATVYKVTENVLSELLGRAPNLYVPPRTQFLTEKGDVVDAPLIKAPGKAGGPHRK